MNTDVKKIKWSLIILFHTSYLMLFTFLLAEAQNEKPPSMLKTLIGDDKDKGPITIESDQASFDKKAGLMVYSGHVLVRRGNMTINSDRLKGFLDENQKEINRMLVEGDVIVIKDDKTIKAETAIYYREQVGNERLELEGNPVVYMQKNSIKADKMIYYLTTDLYEAKGNVRAFFHSRSSQPSSLPVKESQTKNMPVTITSKDANFYTQKNKARFFNDVKVIRDDVELTAQNMEVFLEKETNKINKIIASDQVKIVQKDKEITADQGTFFEKEKKIVLTGNPVSRQGKDVLSGQKIVYYLDSETVEVKKAKTTIHPKKTGEGDKSFFSLAPKK